MRKTMTLMFASALCCSSIADDGGSATSTTGSMLGHTSTGSTSTEEEGEESTTTEESCSFIDCSTGPHDIPYCDNWQYDCPEGEKCSAYDSNGMWEYNASRCREIVDEPSGVGEECRVIDNSYASGYDTCDLHGMCWHLDENGFGVCVPVCRGTEQMPICPNGTVCNISNYGSLLLCLPEE